MTFQILISKDLFNMTVKYVNLSKQWNYERKDLLGIIDNQILKGDWVNGSEIEKFEKKITKICKTKYCVALNSGTDALVLGLMSLNVKRGDEVITTSNSFIASTAAIVHIGAKPVFVDVSDDQNIDANKIEKKITSKTKAIMPVHLTGRVSNMKKIIQISKKYKIPVIEDAAQSIGSKLYSNPSGSFGDIGCFSAHALKNLNAIGDSGYLVTNNYNYYKKVKSMRNHGMENRNIIKSFGYVSRMDNLQATVLNYRIKNLEKIISSRRYNANLYLDILDNKNVFIPREKDYEFNTYHTFVVQVEKRKKLIDYLISKKIETAIHYPIPIHLQPCSKSFGYTRGSLPKTERQAKKILTLPINQYLSKKNVVYVAKSINEFYRTYI